MKLDDVNGYTYRIEFKGYAILYAEDDKQAIATLLDEDNEFIALDIMNITRTQEDFEPKQK